MKKFFALVGITLLGAGCIMINSTSRMQTEAKIQYRSSESRVEGASNVVSNGSSWEGGGKADLQVPISPTK